MNIAVSPRMLAVFHERSFVMRSKELFKRFVSTAGKTFLLAILASACAPTPLVPKDKNVPMISSITTSSKGFSIDCVPTSITVTANITDSSRITSAVLWYHVGRDQSYTPVNMEPLTGNNFTATVEALDIPVGTYGVWEFYIAAEDALGNLSQSPPDTSVQLLACVSH